MNYILNLLVNAGVVMLMAYILPQVRVKSFGTALWVAFLVSILNVTVGFLLRLPLNLVTFFLLSFFVRLIVTAIIIKLVDKLLSNFEVRGFWPALVIALAIAIAGALFDRQEAEERYDTASQTIISNQTVI
ncbi:phage holin family protein [Adhaeribacter radiodurans]|uniref:Phage holin family protein n=1 Tax=Adhaeribacter radiodurans TaxID=2745197 RepID=A0A7L7L6I2_9BACT|nr:phage holin family protein [Adhaeribacter radiodurans]QMU28442.1 phage holin family protein [Adhaeribacter radiodurans]